MSPMSAGRISRRVRGVLCTTSFHTFSATCRGGGESGRMMHAAAAVVAAPGTTHSWHAPPSPTLNLPQPQSRLAHDGRQVAARHVERREDAVARAEAERAHVRRRRRVHRRRRKRLDEARLCRLAACRRECCKRLLLVARRDDGGGDGDAVGTLLGLASVVRAAAATLASTAAGAPTRRGRLVGRAAACAAALGDRLLGALCGHLAVVGLRAHCGTLRRLDR